jgi:hypothetical protein
MQNNKRVLVNGCSFSCGPDTWPYYLQKKIGFNLINLAQGSAGNKYIHDSTIDELSQRKYDMVIIMWSGLGRFDCQVEDISLFEQSRWTSLQQKRHNDWPGKIIHPINDQDYVDENWIFACMNNNEYLKKIKFGDTHFKYVGIEQLQLQFLRYMISLQSILKQLEIPYLFTFYMDYYKELKDNKLFCMIDHDNVFDVENIYNITVKNNWFNKDKIHPGNQAHTMWADIISTHLLKKYHAENS